MNNKKENINIGFALTGSFCTFAKALEQMRFLVDRGYNVYPILSENSATLDTRFGKSADFIEEIRKICGRDIIKSIVEAEPIGPEKILDILIIAPCTGNTLAKLAIGITDTSVTMAAKAHLRNNRPLVIAVSTNDGLGSSAKNIGALLNYKNIFFVPFNQDDYAKKPKSLSADFGLLETSVQSALSGIQIQPILFS